MRAGTQARRPQFHKPPMSSRHCLPLSTNQDEALPANQDEALFPASLLSILACKPWWEFSQYKQGLRSAWRDSITTLWPRYVAFQLEL